MDLGEKVRTIDGLLDTDVEGVGSVRSRYSDRTALLTVDVAARITVDGPQQLDVVVENAIEHVIDGALAIKIAPRRSLTRGRRRYDSPAAVAPR